LRKSRPKKTRSGITHGLDLDHKPPYHFAGMNAG